MSGIVKNMFIYHVVSLLLGMVFFYGARIAFNLVGVLLSPAIEISRSDPSQWVVTLINFFSGIVSALFQALVIMVIAHYILAPQTRLFVVGSSIGFVAFSAWGLVEISSFYMNTYYPNNYYIFDYTAKAIGSLMVLWGMASVYIKFKPNQAN